MTAIPTRRALRRRTVAFGALALGACVLSPARAIEFSALVERPPTADRPAEASGLAGGAARIGADPDRPVLLHFFATWCAPCREELPALAAFVAARPALRAVAIDVGEPASRAAAFVAPYALGFPVALDGNRAIARRLGVGVLPSTILFTPGGARELAAAGAVDWTAPETAEAVDALSDKLLD